MFTRKELVMLFIPLIIEQILSATIGFADTLMVAIVGEAAVSGVSLVDSINFLLISIFSALATGGTIVASQYLGANDKENANHAASQLVLVTGLLSLGITGLCLLLRRPILSLLFGHIEADVMANALIYFLLSAVSYPFLAVYNSCAALFRSMGNAKLPMGASLLMNLINVTGNAVFIFGFNMGVAGAALGSLISRAVGCLIVVFLLTNPQRKISLAGFFPIVFRPQMIKTILSIGVPSGIENGMFQIGKILVQGIVATFGTAGIAANAVANSISSFTVMPGMAIGLGTIPVVGHCIGAKNYAQAKKYMIQFTLISMLTIIILNIAILGGMEPILKLYDLSASAHATARQIIIFHALISIAFWAPAFTLPNGLRAANDIRFTLLTSLITMWTLRVFLGYVLCTYTNVGVLGVWISMGADWVLRDFMFIGRLFSGKWQKKQLI